MSEPTIKIFPLELDFGEVGLGTSSTDIVTIFNDGDADLIVAGIEFQPGSSPDFTISTDTIAGQVVGPMQSVEIEITFSPSAETYSEAVLKIDSNDPNAPLTDVVLSGAGVIVDDDSDGVPEDNDLCPNSSFGEVVDANGCGIDQICPCSDPWKNHGEYVS